LETLVRLPNNTLNPQAFDALAAGVPAANVGAVRFDLRHCEFIEPFGIVGLLFLLRHAAARQTQVVCDLPHSAAVRAYLSAMDFYRQAEPYAELYPAPTGDSGSGETSEGDFSLALTPIHSEADVTEAVKGLIARVRSILTRNLQYNPTVLNKICVALAEICQNIPQHSDDWGTVALQSYRSRNRPDDRFVKFAVGDLGVGIRQSLASRQGSADLNDAEAIRSALRFGVSRFGEPGRGLGLAAVAALAKAVGGSLQVRSGRARVLLRGAQHYVFSVPFFPGTQVSLELPARQLFTPLTSDGPLPGSVH